MTMTTERLSPTSLRVTRRFAAPPALVWQAHTDPDLIRRWLFGPDGWVLTRCEHDARPGGKMFYRWEMEDGSGGFELTGEVLNVIRALADEGMTMVVVTHEIGFAASVGNRICFLDHGRLLFHDTPEAVFAKPRNPRLERFLDTYLDRGAAMLR